MSIYEMHWDSGEKKVARTAFDKAYQNEMLEIKRSLFEKVTSLKDANDLWSIHDYLSEKRKMIDRKYDYRYSQLILVFSQLLKQGYIKEEDLVGLSEDKIEAIKKLSSDI